MLNKLSFNLMNELNESETKSYKIKKKVIMESNCVKTEDCNVELNNSEEPTHQVLNEENSDAVDRLFSGNELYFRDADGTAIMIHYAENYPQPEEYDEGYKTEFGGSEDALNAAQQAAENGDVWELVEVDNEGNFNGTIYGYAYGIDELKEYLKDLREVKVKKSLEEAAEFFGYSISDDIENYGGPVGFDRFLQRAINYGIEDEAFEKYGSRSNTNVNKLAREYYKKYKNSFKNITKDLKEDMIDDNIEAARQDSIEKGLTSESEEVDLDEPSEDDNKNILQSKKDELEARLGEILMSIKDRQMDTEEFRALSREAAEIDSQITDLDNQINGLYEKDCSKEVKENCNDKKIKKECDKPITEANVSKKVMLKNQGNIYMFECKGNKDFTHIVGENYNESENLLENVETYTSKEEADKDYLKRCGLTEGYTSKDIEDGLDESDDLEKRNILLSRLISMYPDISEEDEDFFSTLSYEELKKEILNWGFDLGELDLDESSKVVASGLAKDGGKYKKIDLYVNGKYETSTNSYKTVKEAIAALKNKDEYKDKKVTGEFSKQ